MAKILAGIGPSYKIGKVAGDVWAVLVTEISPKTGLRHTVCPAQFAGRPNRFRTEQEAEILFRENVIRKGV